MAKVTLQKKCDTRFSDLLRVAVGQCEICAKPGRARKKDGLEIKGLELHHLIGRSVQQWRYWPPNAVILDTSHHGSHPNYRNSRICAHGSADTYSRFVDWLKGQKLPTGQTFFEWVENHKELRPPLVWNHRDMYDCLMGIKMGSTVTEITEAVTAVLKYEDLIFQTPELDYGE